MKHTQGKWEAIFDDSRATVSSHMFGRICTIPHNGKHKEEHEANAILIAQAGTVTNECKLTPLELFDQRNELLDALIRWQNEWIVNGTPAQRANNYSIEQQISRAIEKATGEKKVKSVV